MNPKIRFLAVVATVCLSLGSISGARAQAIYSVALSGNTAWAVAGGGDLDGDGVDDVVACDATGGISVTSGRFGVTTQLPSGIVTWSAADVELAVIGDATGDGAADFVVGESIDVLGNGRVSLVSGASGAVVWQVLGNLADRLGYSVSSVGDIDGDGYADVLASGRFGAVANTPGYVVLISGQSGTVIGVLPVGTGGGLPPVVSGGADIDGDAIPDVAVGLAWEPTGIPNVLGRVQAFSGASLLSPTGPVLLYDWLGSNPGDAFGLSVDARGDLNGDGRGDVLVGAPGTNNNQGAVLAFSGLTGGVLQQIGGTSGFGAIVSIVGDTNGDGAVEFAVRNLLAGNGQQVLVFGTGSTVPIQTIAMPSLSMEDFDSAGDVNGDGVSDLVIASSDPLPPPFGPPTAVVSIQSLAALPIASAMAVGTGCGSALAPSLSLSAAPVLGSSLTVDVSSSLAGASGGLFVGTPANVFVGGNCTVYLSPQSVSLVASFSVDGAGQWAMPVQVPVAAPLAGIGWRIQAALVGSASIELTNGVDVTLGY